MHREDRRMGAGSSCPRICLSADDGRGALCTRRWVDPPFTHLVASAAAPSPRSGTSPSVVPGSALKAGSSFRTPAEVVHRSRRLCLRSSAESASSSSGLCASDELSHARGHLRLLRPLCRALPHERKISRRCFDAIASHAVSVSVLRASGGSDR